MENELLMIKEEALAKLDNCSSLKELNDIRILYLGKKGPIQEAMKSMKDMAAEDRKVFGQTSNFQKNVYINKDIPRQNRRMFQLRPFPWCDRIELYFCSMAPSPKSYQN